MLTTILVGAVVLLAAAVAASLWLRGGPARDPAAQVRGFEAARAVTSRWASDPDATPAPLRDYVQQQRAREQSPDDGRAER